MKDSFTAAAAKRSLALLLLLAVATAAWSADSVRIVLTGDILLDRGVRQQIDRCGIDRLFTPAVDSLFGQAHIVVGNLECPATRIRRPVMKRYCFRAEPEWLPALHRHGITHLNLANNHSIDQGRDALIDTRSNIIGAGMTPIGAGRNMQEAAQPILLADQPRNIWIVASLRLPLENFPYLTDKPCVSQESIDSLVQRIRHLRSSDPSAYIIVSLHWGGEHTLKPVASQRIEAHRLIDAGADCLVCHHTHTLQTIETYRQRKIYYSIGNFIFDQHKPLNIPACLVELIIGRDTATVKTHFIRSGWRPTLQQ